MEDLVSILIPVYNREKLIRKAVESSINQTYRSIEIIIIDNNSNDNTWTVLKELKKVDDRIKIFRNRENIGPSKNWLNCLNEASGKYIKLLFSDDWMDYDFIEKAISFFNSDESIGFVYSRILLHRKKSITYQYEKFKTSKIYSSKRFLIAQFTLKGNVPLSPGCALFRRKDFQFAFKPNIENDWGFDFSKNGAGVDLLIYLIIASKYENIAFMHNPVSHFLGSDDSFTENNDLLDYYTLAKFHFIDNYSDNKLFFRALITFQFIIKRIYKRQNWSRLLFMYLSKRKISINV